MCGITGIVRFNRKVTNEEVQRMTDAVSHRGPDGDGIWTHQNVGFGHRRLAIIDTSPAGRQPMASADGKLWITFNGDIYNYLEIKEELKHLGHKFISASDTEVMIYAYREWGEECVKHFRGMFAFGIVDIEKRTLFVAKDHLGIKPIVFYHDQNVFAFASEIQALRQVDGIKLDIDLEAMDQYLWLQYIPAPRSIFHQVHKLLPGHSITIHLDGEVEEPKRFWQPEFIPNHKKSKQDWIAELESVLKDSVAAHMTADVPVGAFLSGGVDSTAVVTMMAQLRHDPIKTFSISFKEQDYDESRFAKMVAEKWHTDHYVEVVEPHALEILPTLAKHYGEPFGDSSAVPTYYISRLAREHVTVSLSGDGGDETLGGYGSYVSWMSYLAGKSDDSGIKQKIFDLIKRALQQSNPRVSLEGWLSQINYMPADFRRGLWRPEHRQLVEQKLDLFEDYFKQTKSYSNLHKVQYMDLMTYMPFDILTKVDIASMAHGLEARPPFIDWKVVEFTSTIPEKFNMGEVDGHMQGKLILKQMLEKYYPREFLYRQKMGFAMPVKEWFETDGKLFTEFKQRLLNKEAKLNEYFEPAVVKSIVELGAAGHKWQLFFLEEWLSQNT